MIKLAVISHALVQDVSQKRWKTLAENYPVDVSLLVPRTWESTWLKDKVVFKQSPFSRGRFHVFPMATTSKRKWNRYFFISCDAKLREIAPDIIYVIHEEGIWVHQQIITYRNIWAPESKLIFFSMNALGVPQRRPHHRWQWKRIKRSYDAALCHYPGCLKSLRAGGFDKPVFMQTQIGVDEDLYYPDTKQKHQTRKQLKLNGRFVIGFTGRLTKDKGVHDLLGSLPLEGVNWSLLLVGDGEYREEIEREITTRGWEDRVILTGTVPQAEVATYMRAMDCLVVPSRTRDYWIDTFPNATVQAMACGIPVIGSDSGAIPFQLGDAGLIFPEGDREMLSHHLRTLADSGEMRNELSFKSLKRCSKYFGVESLTENFYDMLKQISLNEFNTGLKDDDQRKAW